MQADTNRPDPARSLLPIVLALAAVAALSYGPQLFGGGSPTDEGESQAAEETTTSPGPRTTVRESQRAERAGAQQLATITTDEMVVTLSNMGGGLTNVHLRGEQYREAEAQLDLVTTSLEEYLPLRIDLPDPFLHPAVNLPVDAVWELEQRSPREVGLTWRGNGLEVRRVIRAGEGPYQLEQSVQVKNTSEQSKELRLRVSTWHYISRESERGGNWLSSWLGSRSPLVSQGVCRHQGETTRKTRDDLVQRHGYAGVEFVAVENTYFVQALAPTGGSEAEYCGLEADDRAESADSEPLGSLFEASLVYPATTIAPGQSQTWGTLAYLGPKVPTALDAAGHNLPEVVNLGMFAFIARGFTVALRWIHGYVGNWGLAIILLTVAVRLMLFPLFERSFRSMAQMRKLKPEMDEINARYGNDMEKKNAAIMELYRKRGVSVTAQAAGCLPMLLQMPVFFALYASLSTNIELYHQPLALWWTDLSAPDPFLVLPLMLGGLMFLQQRLTPTTMDPQQARMMQFMPLMFTGFMLFLPAGLCVYMLTNSVLSLAQQRLNEWRLNREQVAGSAA